MEADVAILGAGFAGLGAGYAAQKLGKRVIIFEKDTTYGGLCGNFRVDGFHFDQAIHMSFTEDELCQSVFFSQPYYRHSPEALNYKKGVWIRNPVQNNLRALPVDERIKIIKGFVERKKAEGMRVENYREWLDLKFGQYFTDNYPELYTRKYWATNSYELSASWCGARIYQPSLDEVLAGAFPDAEEPENVYYAKIMRYPKKGGYKTFVKACADALDIRYGHEAVNVDTENKVISMRNGATCSYQTLISTIPLPVLARLVSADENITEAAQKLKSTSMALVSVGFKKEIKFPTIWFYVYDEEIPFARAYSPSMKSPDNAPEGKSSLQFEIYYSEEFPLKDSDEHLTQRTLDAMEQMGLAKKEDVEAIDIRHVRYANIMFYLGMEEYRGRVRRYMHDLGIVTCGRFGEWDYLWSHQSFLSGYDAVINFVG